MKKIEARSWNDAAAYDCGRDRVIGMPSFTERGISRSDGMKTFGSLPSTATTSCWLMPTRVSARLRTSWIFFGS